MKNLYLAIIAAIAGTSATAQNFPALDTTFNTKVVIAPSPFVVTPLFSGSANMVVKPASLGGGQAPAKQNHDYTGIVSINDSTEAYLIVNHELSSKDDNLDDGGGMTAFKVKRTNGNWAVNGDYRYVDFKSTVGGTVQNCGGAETPNQTTVTAEEYPPVDNLSLFTGGFRDTSDYTIPAGSAFAGSVIKRYENFGWLVNVDPVTGMAKEKYYKMGKLSHEGALFMPDNKTVYITDDNTPAVFLKFVANVEKNYTDGQLYAYKQSANGQTGEWLAMPMTFAAMKDARNVALGLGATMFNRLEWVVAGKNGRVFITETGRDDVTGLKSYMKAGTNMPAYHLMNTPGINDGDSTFTDYYGRVLEFVPATSTMKVFVEGGNAVGDLSKNLSNPDGLATTRVNGRDFLMILEDLNGASQNRSGGQNNNICEAYIVDINKPSATVAELTRFMIGPNGAELTGGTFMPDGKTFFVNIQHPSNSNTPPYNNSTTVAVSNYAQYLTTVGVEEVEMAKDGFSIYPNPATREIRFNQTTDIAVYNASGSMIRVARNVSSLDVSNLTPGMYFIQTINGQVQRLIVQ